MTTPTRDEAVRQQFEAAIKDAYETWCRPRMSNIEPDHPSDAFAAGYQAALRSPAVRGLVEAAEDMLCPSYRGPDQDRLRAALRTLGAGHVE